jgi:hypothetical protein
MCNSNGMINIENLKGVFYARRNIIIAKIGMFFCQGSDY